VSNERSRGISVVSPSIPPRNGQVWGRHLRELPAQVWRRLVPKRTVKARGVRFTLRCETWITEWRWRNFRTKEPETLDWIDRWVKDGETFFDIGANIGEFSLYAALRHPRLHVVAFEPEYANVHLLRDNLMENGLQDRVTVYSIALGNRTGVSHLHIQDATPGAALHTESSGALGLTRTHKPVIWQEGVYTMTLDAFCEETGLSPKSMKIDVDGTEREILEGASRTLRSPALRTLVVEMFGGPHVRDACARLLHEAGLRRMWWNPGQSENEIWIRA